MLLSDYICKFSHFCVLSLLSLCKNIQQQPPDFADLFQNRNMILFVFYQLLCQLIQCLIHPADNTIYSVSSPPVQKVLSGKSMGGSEFAFRKGACDSIYMEKQQKI